MFTSEPTPSPHHMLCSAFLNLSGFHYSSLNKWKQSKMAEDPSNVVLQSGKEQLESKIKSTTSTEERMRLRRI
jgi:hypothetical protein